MIWENEIKNILDLCLKIKTCNKMDKDDIDDHENNYYA
jgi:hypothetical protein